eukprot:1190011-Rhodomonas_salina.3
MVLGIEAHLEHGEGCVGEVLVAHGTSAEKSHALVSVVREISTRAPRQVPKLLEKTLKLRNQLQDTSRYRLYENCGPSHLIWQRRELTRIA